MNNCLVSGNQNSEGAETGNAGSWSLEENVAYTIFIDIHKKSMTSKKKMREIQFYDKLAAFVATRSCSQCRSHHQKLFNKYKYISKIREVFKTEIGILNYKLKFQQGQQKMVAINRSFDPSQQTTQIEAAPQRDDPIEQLENTPAAVSLPQLIPLPGLSLNYRIDPLGMMMNPFGWFSLASGLSPFMAHNFLA